MFGKAVAAGLVALIMIVGTIYGCVGFIAMSFNPMDWSILGRAAFVLASAVISLPVSIGITVGYYSELEDKAKKAKILNH